MADNTNTNNLNVSGNAVIGHDLTVHGNLVTDNVIGPDKGMFQSRYELVTSYPHPQDGWYAIVGTSLNGDVYTAKDGQWQATGEKGAVLELSDDQVNDLAQRLNKSNYDAAEHLGHFDTEAELMDALNNPGIWNGSSFHSILTYTVNKGDGSQKDGGVVLQSRGSGNQMTQYWLSDNGAIKVRTTTNYTRFTYTPSVPCDIPWSAFTLNSFNALSDADKAKLSALPTAQTTNSATASDHKYIYSGSGSTAVVTAGKFLFEYNSNSRQISLQLGAWDPTNAARSKFTKRITIPAASSTEGGLMSISDKAKLDGYPEARTATESSWGLMGADHARKLATCWPNVYGRHEGVKRAVNGIFSLPSNATVAQIEAALTEYSTKAVLTPLELENCATNGMMLYDEATQGFVTVTHNGGGMFNFIELSAANYGQLPRLRFCSLLLTADTKQVKRSGQEERICFKSELDNVQSQLNARIDTLDNALSGRIAAIEADDDVVYIHDYDTQTAPDDIPGGDNNSNDHTAGWICYIAQANAFALRRWQAPYDYIGWLYPTGEETYGTYAQLTLANGYYSVCRPYKRKLYMARTTNWGITSGTFAPVLLYALDTGQALRPVQPLPATTTQDGLMSKEDKAMLVGTTSVHDNMQAQLESLQTQLNNLLQTLRDNGTI